MAKRQITIPIFLPHSGCPHRCAFCNQLQSSGACEVLSEREICTKIENHLRMRPSTVVHTEIAFFGGNFTGLSEGEQRRLLSLAKSYKEQGQVQAIRLSTRPDYISREGLDVLRQGGVDTVEIGVQSFNDQILEAAHRGHTSGDVIKAVALLRDFGMQFILQLMAGLPHSTMQDEISSAEKAASLNPAGVRIFPTVILEHTELARFFTEGTYAPLSLEEAVERCSLMAEIFIKQDIPVIRMGLNPLNPVEEEKIIAGPYHTSFGFLVNARIKRNLLEKSLENFYRSHPGCSHLIINLPSERQEEFIGHKRENIAYLKERFEGIELSFITGKSRELRIASAIT